MTRLDSLSVPLGGTNLIEASAGTGKTYAITNLYLRLVLEVPLSVNQILVVTYTNAATAELRARVRRRLRECLEALDGGSSPDAFIDPLLRKRRDRGTLLQDRAKLLVALQTFDEAAIFTIHGFCQRMLHDHAFESGVSFDTELITNEGPLVSEVVQDFWVRELHAAPESFVQDLAARKITPATLENLAVQVLRHPGMRVLPRPNEQLTGSAQQSEDARALEFRLKLIAYAQYELRRRKEWARIQSFDDLLQRLAEALRGAGGPGLAEMIRGRFRAALIDEFQDTDPVQYEIFRTVYLGSEGTLFLIGDPKQAIYAFRGADVFTYMGAKRDTGGEPYTLGTNQRSDPSLIAGVNHLFGRLREPFVFEAIPFLPVEARLDAADCLGGSAIGQAPLQILFVPRVGQEGNGGFINKQWGEGPLTRAVAGDIVRLLNSRATIGNVEVKPGDIAVLCRKNVQAALMQQALRAVGVPSVLQSDASVFESPEAEQVERVVRAMAEPGNSRALRAALGTPLFGQTAQDLAALEHDEQRWDDWMGQFQAWHERWTQRSFVVAFRNLLGAQGVPQRLLGLLDGERRLTNVLHLMELLHTASTEERRGPHELLHWLRQMRTDVEARAELAAESAQIRLESDAAAVKLTTVHKSKGLQYPIVYCPYLWDGALLSPSDKSALRFHDPAESDRLTLDVGSREHEVHVALAEREAFAENLRLLYVALTRAQHRCTVVWGAFRSAGDSALGYVLHQPPGAVADLRTATRARIESLAHLSDEAIRADLADLTASAPGCIAVTDLCLQPAGRYRPAIEGAAALEFPEAPRGPSRSWRVSSFSALTSSERTGGPSTDEGLDHDAEGAPLATHPAPAADSGPIVLHDFPAGVRAGQLVHKVLENLDFTASGEEAVAAVVTTTLARFGFEPRWAEPLSRAIADVLVTPLHDGAQSMRLRDVPLDRRLNEVEFIFPIAGDDPNDGRLPRNLESPGQRSLMLTAERLAAVLARPGAAPMPADYGERVRALDFGQLAGFLRGYIDLVFQHGGRWYLADYKSNHLGVSPDDYRRDMLVKAMAHHHYFLQYHLYVVALHRYLSNRLRNYDYDRDFGGVYYLFLRGMGPGFSPGNGVFHDRPSCRLIEELSAVLAGGAGDG